MGLRVSRTRSASPPASTRTREHIDALARARLRLHRGRHRHAAAAAGQPAAAPVPHCRRSRRIINRFGFNNVGVDAFAAQRRARATGAASSASTSARTPTRRSSARPTTTRTACGRSTPRASYVTVNISSPNTKDLRELQQDAQLDALARQRSAASASRWPTRHGKRVPLALKIAPDLDDAADRGHRRRACGATASTRVIATNTRPSREGVEGLPHASEAGGLSGAPVRARVDRGARRTCKARCGGEVAADRRGRHHVGRRRARRRSPPARRWCSSTPASSTAARRWSPNAYRRSARSKGRRVPRRPHAAGRRFA